MNKDDDDVMLGGDTAVSYRSHDTDQAHPAAPQTTPAAVQAPAPVPPPLSYTTSGTHSEHSSGLTVGLLFLSVTANHSGCKHHSTLQYYVFSQCPKLQYCVPGLFFILFRICVQLWWFRGWGLGVGALNINIIE